MTCETYAAEARRDAAYDAWYSYIDLMESAGLKPLDFPEWLAEDNARIAASRVPSKPIEPIYSDEPFAYDDPFQDP